MNWEEHFRALNNPETRMNIHTGFGSDDFGGFLGKHTIDDLKHMVEAYDYAFNQLELQIQDMPETDPETTEWLDDWMTLRERYLKARHKAETVINEWSVQPDSMRTAEPEYQGILKALQKDPSGPYDKGDYQDMYNRLAAILKRKPVLNMPQPKQDFDTAFVLATSNVADTVNAALNPLDAFTDQLKKNPLRTAAFVVGGAFGLKMLFKLV